MSDHQYLEINRKAWNEKTTVHKSSEFYGMKEFLAGKSSLKPIELQLLGDITGKKILHLQCHFGQDTISMARMGAEVTGVDFSDEAIHLARELSQSTGVAARFIQSDVYTLPDHHQETYDIVFTTYGVLGWLPDMNRWGEVAAHYVKPGGKLILVEFHPAVWMFDDDFSELTYSYFNRGPIIETETGSYADRTADIQPTTIGWNHPLSDVFSSLLAQSMTISHFGEYDYSPYNCLRHLEETEPGKFRFTGPCKNLPMVYSIVADKVNK